MREVVFQVTGVSKTVRCGEGEGTASKRGRQKWLFF